MKTVMLGGAGRSAARGRMSPACPWDGRKAEAAPGSPGHVSRRTTRRTRAVRGSALPGAGAGDGLRLRFLRGAWARLLQLQPPSLAPAPVATRPSPGILTSRFAEQVRIGVTGSPALHSAVAVGCSRFCSRFRSGSLPAGEPRRHASPAVLSCRRREGLKMCPQIQSTRSEPSAWSVRASTAGRERGRGQPPAVRPGSRAAGGR